MAGISGDLKKIGISNALKSCQIFKGLGGEDLEKIAAVTVVKPMEKGQYLFREGDAAGGFYIVQSGAINVHRVTASGKEQVIHVFRPGESFAEAAIASEKGYPADARAVESSQVLLVQKAGFLDLVSRQPDLAMRMLASMSGHLRALITQLEDLTLKDVETRLANWLIKRCPDPFSEKPVHIQLTATKRVLAAELGTVSETLSRTLAKYREQNLVSTKGKTLIVRSPIRLMGLLRGNLGER